MTTYTISQVTELNRSDFDMLYDQCEEAMLRNYPFITSAAGQNLDNAGKREHIWDRYVERLENGFVWQSHLDGHLVAMHCGELNADARCLYWYIMLAGADKDGQAKWWFNEQFAIDEKERFWDVIGVDCIKAGFTKTPANGVERYVSETDKSILESKYGSEQEVKSLVRDPIGIPEYDSAAVVTFKRSSAT